MLGIPVIASPRHCCHHASSYTRPLAGLCFSWPSVTAAPGRPQSCSPSHAQHFPRASTMGPCLLPQSPRRRYQSTKHACATSTGGPLPGHFVQWTQALPRCVLPPPCCPLDLRKPLPSEPHLPPQFQQSHLSCPPALEYLRWGSDTKTNF